MQHTKIQSPNFAFLGEHDGTLLEFAARAERYVLDDPNTTLIKLRQLAEEFAELAAAYNKLYVGDEDGFSDLLRKLKRKHIITREMADIFHGLRKAGNAAAHEAAGTRKEAVHQLKLAHRLAVWFHQAFRNPGYRPGPFVLPPNPPRASAELKGELDRLRKERWDSERRADETEDALKRARREQQSAEDRARKTYADLEAALALAEESEERRAALKEAHQKRVVELQAVAARSTTEELDARARQAQEAAAHFDLTEGEARERIDAQLRSRGWEADSVVRTWQNGARPQAGRNQAIAFSPTGNGYADYVLFCGETVVAIIEAKRRNNDLRKALDEAEEYSRCYQIQASEQGPEAGNERHIVPLVFSSNGRPYADDSDTMHGIWFCDLRLDAASPRPLECWPTPQELATNLKLSG
jgi:type I restriction enzyme, R subunit